MRFFFFGIDKQDVFSKVKLKKQVFVNKSIFTGLSGVMCILYMIVI